MYGFSWILNDYYSISVARECLEISTSNHEPLSITVEITVRDER